MKTKLKSNIAALAKRFVGLEQTLAFAESCTGGLLSSLFVAEAGASEYFMGSVISYDRKVKEKLLKVPMTLMQVMGEVSAPVAVAMARGVRESLKVDWALSITGTAGPGGGTVDKPVGTVCFALIGPGFDYSTTKYFDAGDRNAIQEQSVQFAIEMLMNATIIKSES